MSCINLCDLFLWQISIILIGVIISSEILLNSSLERLLRSIYKLLQKVFKLFQSPYFSDEKKETLVFLYSKKLLLYSTLFLMNMLFILFPIIIIFWFLFDLKGLTINMTIVITVISFAYLFFRLR
jgi:hypothetical protein